jgi:hypothetical protein
MRIPKSAKKSVTSLKRWLSNKTLKPKKHKTLKQSRSLAKARRVRISNLRRSNLRRLGSSRKIRRR